MKTTADSRPQYCGTVSRPEPPINPNWLAFFRRVRELAELARQREAAVQASAGLNATPAHSGKHPAATSTIDKKLAPADTGAIANPLDY